MNYIQIFRRTTNSKNFVAEIDGLRFFAIITVVLFHLNTAYVKELGMSMGEWSAMVGTKSITDLGWWMIRLDLGVKVFFSISGFILAIPFINQYYFQGRKVDIGDYLYRRLTRLEPPFIVTLVIFFVAQVILWNQGWLEMLPHFLSGLLYLHVFSYGYPNPINPVTWSLEIEAQFYLILPLLVLLIFRLKSQVGRTLLLIGFMAVSIFFRGYTLSAGLSHIGSSILVYFVNFGTGIIFALIYMHYRDFFSKQRHLLYDLVTVLAILGVFWFYKPQAYWLNNLVFNLSVLALFVGVFKGTVSNWLFTRPIIYLIGGMCYTIYLLHYAFFHVLVKFSVGISTGVGYWADFGVQFLFLFPVMLLVSAVFYLLIEKPCMDKSWPSRLYAYLNHKAHEGTRRSER
ncbi:acyltransferase family protein [Cecembia rubra]|uniref:acyltransferase family protein n=1 Tax=Cecembia rubra TaxID=1485585 RepID=UPI0027145FBB|nr:acyltransferase [Cecembia rubra]